MESIVELGGGSNPRYHPNVDCRAVKGVDIVADFEKPLPLPTEEFDAVYSQYTIEHISWRCLKGFIAEIYRILKPNGKVTIITADLYEQCKKAVGEPWTENTSCMIFGDQNYGENSHRCGFSPAYAERLFREAGFDKINITHLPNCATDMMIEGEKMEKFGRKYFDGEGYGTGKGDFYRDFPQHYFTAQKILDRKPKSVLEIGGARGYVCKILQANGVPATCMDISKHCWHTRAIKQFTLWDATETPWGMHRQEWLTQISGQITGIPDKYSFQEWITSPIMPKEFDLCFSIAFLEHVPEDKLPNMILEMARVTKRGLHGITFTIKPEDHDSTHVTVKPKEWWEDVFKKYAPNYPVEIVDKESLEEPIGTLDWQRVAPVDGLVKLNIGCFADMFYYGWINTDKLDLREWAKSRRYVFEQMDVVNGISRPDNSVDIILASHFIEHLTREEGAKFLLECCRVLKPEGLLRLVVPDAKLLSKRYLDEEIMEYRHVNISVDNAPDMAEAFFQLLLSGHKTILDEESLGLMLKEAGFIDIQTVKPFESASKAVELQTISMYPTLSLYLEAKKHGNMLNEEINTISRAELGKQASTHVESTSKAPETAENLAHYKKEPSFVNTPRDGGRKVDLDFSSGKLKIALLSTPLLTVPPINYGGLEMIVADLGSELSKLGHDVTIFAPKGSHVEGCRMVEVGDPTTTVFMDWLKAETDMFDQIKAELMTGGYDIIHGHNWFGMEYRAKALDPRLHVLHTHHGGLYADWWTKTRAPFKLNMCAISNWMKTVYEQQGVPARAVYNGVDISQYPMKKVKSDRFLWLSRISTFKAPHIAIELAKKLGFKLDVAGATHFVDDLNYVERIKQSCDGAQIRFIGEVSNEKKLELLQNAKALLVTGKWGEPFGLHVVEALSCGTQVIAVADGGIAETLKGGGVLCQDVDGVADAITHFKKILPTVCRKNALMFSTRQMALNYVEAYRDIIAGNEW